MLIDHILAVPTVLLLQSANPDISDETHDRPLDQSNDSELCLYYLQLIIRIMEYSPNNVWPALSATSASKGITQSARFCYFVEEKLTSLHRTRPQSV